MDQQATSIDDGSRREGVVCRLAPDRRFGYVRTADGRRSYIFVVGRALSHRAAADLCPGSPVSFRVAARDSVEDLRLA